VQNYNYVRVESDLINKRIFNSRPILRLIQD